MMEPHEDEYQKQLDTLLQYRQNAGPLQYQQCTVAPPPQAATSYQVAPSYQQAYGTSYGQAQPQPQDPIIYPDMYAPSGFDLMGILIRIHRRPNPTIPLGRVDSSVALLLCDMHYPDAPILYSSEPFTLLTGYTSDEVRGHNCRFLQRGPPSPNTAPLSSNAKGSTSSTSSKPSVSSSAVRKSSKSSSSKTLHQSHRPRESKEDCEARKLNESSRRELREKLTKAEEAQVKMVNYRKNGERFCNILTVIPIAWDNEGDRRFAVGFLAKEK